MIRLLRATARFAAVTVGLGAAAAGVVLLVALSALGAPRAIAGDATAAPDPAGDLRLAERASAPLEERLAAARRLVTALRDAAGKSPAPTGPAVDVDRVLRVAAALVTESVETACDLATAALDAGFSRRDAREVLASTAAKAAADPKVDDDAARRQDVEAILLLAGVRGRGERLLARTPPTPRARAAVVRDAPELELAADAMPTLDAWRAHEDVARLLDAAAEDDPKVCEPALGALKAAGARALPLLVAAAKPGPAPTPQGLLGRRIRAIVALGAIGDRSATPALLACVGDDVSRHEDGFVRVAAIDALGDLREPRAIGPLCRILFYQGDVHRLYDSWEFPGALFVPVTQDAWAGVENYAIDSAACDALLRLGVRGAAEWLVEQRLDPRTGRWRIRVSQDGIDAIRRAFPDAPASYEPDAGFPQRQAGVDALLAWWRAHPKMARPIDESDADVKAALRAIAERVGGPGVGVMELQIVKKSAALLGATITPSLLDVLGVTTRKIEKGEKLARNEQVQRAEIAAVLGTVRDRRAVAPLLALTKGDPSKHVRANAAEALAAYADPELPDLVDGPAAAGCAGIVARWVEMLDDPDDPPRASAMKALSSVPRHASVLAALDSHSIEKHPENDFDDYKLAATVVRLVQQGDGLDEALGLLDDPVLFRRRFVWELLRVALRLDARAFDPTPDPGTAGRKTLDRAATKAALEKRRTQGCR